jgi:hypothetical protein
MPCDVLVTLVIFRRFSLAHIHWTKGGIAVKKILMLFAIELLLVASAMSALVVHAHSVRISSTPNFLRLMPLSFVVHWTSAAYRKPAAMDWVE